MKLYKSKVLEYKIPGCRETSWSVPMLILHHDFETVSGWCKKKKSLRSVCSVIQRGKGAWKRYFKEAEWPEAGRREGNICKKWHTNRQLMKSRMSETVTSVILEYRYLYIQTWKHVSVPFIVLSYFSFKTQAFHEFYWKLMSVFSKGSGMQTHM